MNIDLIADEAADEAAETVYQRTSSRGTPIVLTVEDRERIAAVITETLEGLV